MLLVASVAAADTPSSPRIEALVKKLAAKERGAEDAFWKQVAAEGTPIIEDVKDPKGRLLVTFVYRAKPGTNAVSVWRAPPALEREPRSRRLIHRTRLAPTHRREHPRRVRPSAMYPVCTVYGVSGLDLPARRRPAAPRRRRDRRAAAVAGLFAVRGRIRVYKNIGEIN